MTFSALKNTVGRQPLTIVEIDFDKCALVYGSSPCTASLATGQECYNTFSTCQDTPNYDNTDTLTLRFSDREQAALIGENVYPCLEKINIAPTKIIPGKGLSQRAKVDLQFIDFIDNDQLTDPYADDRDYIATDSGTFFGKLFARNPHHLGREVRIKTGYFPADGSLATLADFDRVQTYIIDRVGGVDSKGRVKIVAKDVLSLADGLKTQVPAASTGVLNGAITGTPATFAVGVDEGAQYPTAATWYRIGDEILKATRSGDTFTISNRATWGTTSADHDDGESVQECYAHYPALRVDEVLEDLLLNYVGIDASYLPTTDWASEADTWLDDYDLATVISEPTPVSTLLNEICTECGIDLWWSDTDSEIKLKAQVPELTPVTDEITDPEIIEGTGIVSTEMIDRLSQVYFYVGRKSFITSLTDVGNFSNVVVRADLDSETADEYNQKAIKKVYCRWLSTPTQAGQQASRLIARYKTPPHRLKCVVDISSDDIETGDHFMLNSNLLQGVDGQKQQAEMQLLSTKIDTQKQTIAVEALTFRYQSARFAKVAPTGTADYLSATGADHLLYSWVATTTGQKMSNGDDPYLII